MKDTEAFGVIAESGYCCGTYLRGVEDDLEPVVIVSADRYRRLVALEETIKRWVREEQAKEAAGT